MNTHVSPMHIFEKGTRGVLTVHDISQTGLFMVTRHPSKIFTDVFAAALAKTILFRFPKICLTLAGDFNSLLLVQAFN